jgi:WXG100 family type VII secretion target
MASQIRISPDQMRERANSYQTESGNVSEMIGRLDSLLQSLLGGSASEAYRERYESLRPAFTQAEELLAEISKALNTTAQNMENVDESIASGFRG